MRVWSRGELAGHPMWWSGIGAAEIPYGDYSPGRYAWIFGCVTALTTPIPAKGFQGLRDCDPVVAEQIQAQLAERGNSHVD